MRLAAGGRGGGGGGRRREARSGLRLSVPAPPPPPTLKRSKSEGISLVSIAGIGGARNERKSQAAPPPSTSLRRTSPGAVVGAGITTCTLDTRPAGVSGRAHNNTLKTTRARKPQSTTRRPPPTRRTVRFDRCVRMVLVPARRDLDAAIVHGVWWGAEDVAEFRVAAAKHFFKHGGMTMTTTQGGSIGGGSGGATPSEEGPSKQEGSSTKPPISLVSASPLPGRVVVG